MQTLEMDVMLVEYLKRIIFHACSRDQRQGFIRKIAKPKIAITNILDDSLTLPKHERQCDARDVKLAKLVSQSIDGPLG